MSAKKQIPYLHYLRAIAILMVVALHSITPYISDAAIYGKRSRHCVNDGDTIEILYKLKDKLKLLLEKGAIACLPV